MIIPVQVANTLTNGTFKDLSSHSGPFIIEIGSSDRNTVDVEILSRIPNAFLVTAEPLVEKVARAISRRRSSHTVIDSFEPLGHQHDRGLVLPMAIGPTQAPEGELQTFQVGGNAGCSSLSNISTTTKPSFGRWCLQIRETRQVWTQSLATLIERFPKDSVIQLVKIDAQGYDLKVIQSAGRYLQAIEYVSMEVVSEDCTPIYENQPKCTEIVQTMSKLGFETLGPVPCVPAFRRFQMNHYCELEIVFYQKRLRALGFSRVVLRFVYELHNIHFNGCNGVYENNKPNKLFAWPKSRWAAEYVWPRTNQRDNTSFGELYACPVSCTLATNALERCPW